MRANDPNFFISPEESLRAAVARINLNQQGIVLVVGPDGRLLRTVTDGDVRRALLAGCGLETPIARLSGSSPGAPVSAPTSSSPEERLGLMRERSIRQLPIVDDQGRVVELALLDEALHVAPSADVVIMAGGQGQRLRPLTKETPKPMLPVAGRPLLEHLVAHVRDAGLERVRITTHFLEDRIVEHFGNGAEFGVEIDYVRENDPLGTAGSLRLLPETEAPLLVINGDILTRVDFRAMLAFHREHQAAVTVAVREYDFTVPYGVVESDGVVVTGLNEKPVHEFFVNAGMYVLEPGTRGLIPTEGVFHMTDLIGAALAAGERVVSFPIHEYWLDIGQHESYQQAQQDAAEGGRFNA